MGARRSRPQQPARRGRHGRSALGCAGRTDAAGGGGRRLRLDVVALAPRVDGVSRDLPRRPRRGRSARERVRRVGRRSRSQAPPVDELVGSAVAVRGGNAGLRAPAVRALGGRARSDRSGEPAHDRRRSRHPRRCRRTRRAVDRDAERSEPSRRGLRPPGARGRDPLRRHAGPGEPTRRTDPERDRRRARCSGARPGRPAGRRSRNRRRRPRRRRRAPAATSTHATAPGFSWPWPGRTRRSVTAAMPWSP